jgi:hypothetical protein
VGLIIAWYNTSKNITKGNFLTRWATISFSKNFVQRNRFTYAELGGSWFLNGAIRAYRTYVDIKLHSLSTVTGDVLKLVWPFSRLMPRERVVGTNWTGGRSGNLREFKTKENRKAKWILDNKPDSWFEVLTAVTIIIAVFNEQNAYE